MIVFSIPQHRGLLPAEPREQPQLTLGRCRFGSFPDGELWVEVEAKHHVQVRKMIGQ